MSTKKTSYVMLAHWRNAQRKKLRIALLLLVLAGLVAGGGTLFARYVLPALSTGNAAQSANSAQAEQSFESVMPASESGEGDGTAQPAVESQAQPARPAQIVQTGPDKSVWNTGTRVEQTLNVTMNTPDWRMLSLPRSPAVSASYFDTATFVGDSLTQGLQLYSTGLPNAHYCAYKGTGPNSIVNGATLTRADGGTEICLDALVASQPDYVYMLLGTNSLVSVGNDDSFLNYYGAMIDLFQANLPEGVIYYVQAIPGVGADVVHAKPGLDNNRIRAINSRLAQLAREKGCYFIDLQEALSDDDGNQLAQYAAADSIHYNADGYQAWVDYLATHTAYHKRNPYVNGNPYYIGTDEGGQEYVYTPLYPETETVETPETAEMPDAESTTEEQVPAENAEGAEGAV